MRWIFEFGNPPASVGWETGFVACRKAVNILRKKAAHASFAATLLAENV
jgi:hypothetical protein